MTEIINVTDDNFKQTIEQSDVPVLVDFWAEWCGPCKMLAPILDTIATEYDGKVKIVKLNIDDNTQIPQEYVIRSIPTLMMFKNGERVETKIGALQKSEILTFIDSHTS